MSPQVVGIVGFALLFLSLAFGVPIVVSFAIVGIVGIAYLSGIGSMLSVLEIIPLSNACNYILGTIPLFVLMGFFAMHSGISRDIFFAAYKWLGRLPGGLAIASMVGCAGFAACCGSSPASAASMGAICLPEMKRYNYDDSLATGTIAVGGTLGILIPPSSGFIIFGALTGASIGKLFIAGILPGLLVATIYSVLIYFRARSKPELAPPGPSSSLKEKISSLKGIWAMLLLFILIMGGIWGGIFTPTEAAAVGALGSFLFALGRRKLTKKNLTSSLSDTLRTSCMILAIVIGAMIFNFFLAISLLPASLVAWITALPLSPYMILVLVLLIYIPLGMFMEPLAMLVLTLPIFFPIMESLGFDPIWFGVLTVRLAELGLVTPPVGMNCYVIKGIVPDVALSDIFRGIIPFWIIDIPILAILVVFPQISLFLPGLMR